MRRLEGGAVEVWWPFDQEALDDFKAAIPHPFRRWDAQRRCWRVDRVRAAQAVAWLRDRFPNADEIPWRRRDEPPPPPPPGGSRPVEPWASLHLLPTAPRPVVDAAYRAMARIAHPDLGGDADRMKRINAAYEQLKGLAR